MEHETEQGKKKAPDVHACGFRLRNDVGENAFAEHLL